MYRNILVVAVVTSFVTGAGGFAATVADNNRPVQTLRIALPDHAGTVLKNIAAVLARQVRQRCGASVVETGDAPFTIELAVEPGIGAEGFTIVDGKPDSVRIVGNDERGVLYGVGKFLRTSRYDQGGFTAGEWRGTSVPQKPIRGIYFATHFHNFYHDAPVEEIQRYVEDLGLWGYNNVQVWNDVRFFDGFDDPKAVEFRRRLRSICQAAQRIGLDVAFCVIGNEGYHNSPVALRADPRGRRGDWSDGQVCPSKPEGIKYLRATLGKMFDGWVDLRPRYLLVGPYDPGGCGCTECQPWGSNGFMKGGEAITRLARQKLPGVKIIMSTWFFDKDEWRDVAKKFAQERPWPDYVLSEDMRKEDYPALAAQVVLPPRNMPGGLPMVGFPEISMYGGDVWGGLGATVLAQRFESQWNKVKARCSGGWPYSEGIFEDVDKALFSQFYWNDRPAAETLREYAAFEYSPEVVDEVLRVFAALERNHLEPKEELKEELRGKQLNLDDRATAYRTVQEVDAKLTTQARKAWRWRQVYLRALLDFQRAKYRDIHNAACQEAFAELVDIYHAQRAAAWVRPPLDPEFRSKSPH